MSRSGVLSPYSTLSIAVLVCFVILLPPIISGGVASSTAKTGSDGVDGFQEPTVLIAVLVRNKAPYLSYFFGNLERLAHPKNRTALFIRLDHCVDNSSDYVDRWLSTWRQHYHTVDYEAVHQPAGYPNEGVPTNWTSDRYRHVIRLRQAALDAGRRMWADYVFMLDADVMLVNPNTIDSLIAHGETVAAPLLNCSNSEPYANFWGAMTKQGYYKRSDDYFDIRYRNKQGLFPVPMVHTALMINLNHRTSLSLTYDPDTFNYTGPLDDIIIFAKSAQQANQSFSFYIDNSAFFGYMVQPTDGREDLNYERDLMLHMKLQVLLDHEGNLTLEESDVLPVQPPPKSKLGYDEIYLINLERRPDRRRMMEFALTQLGIDARYFAAVDGKQLNDTYLASLGIEQLPGYYDPYHKRGLKFGEIGCFLSHYFIWQDMIQRGYEKILLFEDDIRFGMGFLHSLESTLREANKVKPEWDLIYVGRKRLTLDEEYVKNSTFLVYPEYTYWTLSYILNTRGAKKLLGQNPLAKLVAVDEYLPIMFDKHPRKEWMAHFSPRDLIAVSPDNLLVEPYHYTGEPNYYSDTEDSRVVSQFQESLIKEPQDYGN